MGKKFCVLFDMDGVILDSEPQYDVIWKHLGDKYNTGIENFEKVVKGNTLNNILAKYFSHLTEAEVENLKKDLLVREDGMDYTREIKGAVAFIKELRSRGVKVGLVTSSDDNKLQIVYRQNDIRPLFDTIVSANRITAGKPDPMCFLLAAQDLGYQPENAFVFEDSFAGLEAGNRAGMKVIALATTHSRDLVKDKALKTIDDFSQISVDELENI